MASMAAAIDVPAPALLAVLRSHDPGSRTGWDRADTDPPKLLRPFGLELHDLRFDGVYLFHGTRVMCPEAFLRDGILPLNAMLDQIWTSLHQLCAEQVPLQQWQALRQRLETGALAPGDNRQWAGQYRHKVTQPVEQGPFASVVRDLVIRPARNHHDYLGIPEIVREIARCVGLNLQARFKASSTSCIVKFRHNYVDEGTIAAALTYLLTSARSEPLDEGCAYYPSCGGQAVPPDAVITVDEMGPPQRGGSRRRTIRRHHQTDLPSVDVVARQRPMPAGTPATVDD